MKKIIICSLIAVSLLLSFSFVPVFVTNESAFNKYASKPPIIVDSNGKFIAYLTANEYTVDGVTYLELLSILREQHQ